VVLAYVNSEDGDEKFLILSILQFSSTYYTLVRGLVMAAMELWINHVYKQF
jgi:hypothetical protein